MHQHNISSIQSFIHQVLSCIPVAIFMDCEPFCEEAHSTNSLLSMASETVITCSWSLQETWGVAPFILMGEFPSGNEALWSQTFWDFTNQWEEKPAEEMSGCLVLNRRTRPLLSLGMAVDSIRYILKSSHIFLQHQVQKADLCGHDPFSLLSWFFSHQVVSTNFLSENASVSPSVVSSTL